MKRDVLSAIDHDSLRKNLNKYTKKAFRMLPKLEDPHILDIGCGTGVPTLELARLSKGRIMGIDIDKVSLDKLKEKIKEADLTDRVKTVKCSMFNIKFTDESFDVIWTEGAILAIGFRKGLKEWRRLIKSKGFLVVHDEIGDIPKKLELIAICGYKLINHFIVSGDIWWHEYYCPLENQIQELRLEYDDDPNVISILDKEQQEVDEFKKNHKLHGSVFFVMVKC